jgi:hypothetical protein
LQVNILILAKQQTITIISKKKVKELELELENFKKPKPIDVDKTCMTCDYGNLDIAQEVCANCYRFDRYKSKTSKYRLEYSENSGFFHYAKPYTNKDEYGFFCICDNLTLAQCEEFTEKMFEKYPNINTGNKKSIPSFVIIKKEFELFLIN